MLQTTTACAGCEASRQRLRTTCLWCGVALGDGREPTPEERYETSLECHRARFELQVSARRDARAIDAAVLARLARVLPGARFTAGDLVADVGMNTCAIKHALIRLARLGRVRQAGHRRVRSNRFQETWEVVGEPRAGDAT